MIDDKSTQSTAPSKTGGDADSDELDTALDAAQRLAQARARMTGANRDVRLAAIVEAAAHAWRVSAKRGAAIAHAADEYLSALAPKDRRSPLAAVAPASEWTNELRVHVADALERVATIRAMVGVAVPLGKAHRRERFEFPVDTVPLYRRLADDLVRAACTSAPIDFPKREGAAERLCPAIADGETEDVEHVLRALLAALGVASSDVNRLTKAEYAKKRRIKAKGRAQRRAK